jgi:hypothetical protein
MKQDRVAVVVASNGQGPSFTASINGFLREVEGRGEVVLVQPTACERSSNWARGLRLLQSPSGRLMPELWRDGLCVVDADWVAFSTSEMIPGAGWLDALLSRMSSSEIWGVGGAIAAGDRLGRVERAVYLQRFLRYGLNSPLPERPSGENALYRRERLAEIEDAWAEGFWEAEVQRRLEANGGRWAKAPEAIVTYAGSTRLFAIARQRVEHARRFGAIRAADWSRKECWLRGFAAPVVPALLLARAWNGLKRRRMAVGPWLSALPSFLILAAAWATGETLGACLTRSARAGD